MNLQQQVKLMNQLLSAELKLQKLIELVETLQVRVEALEKRWQRKSPTSNLRP